MPPPTRSFRRFQMAVLVAATAALAPPCAYAQTDASSVDATQLLKALRGLREQQTTAVKAQKQSAIQQVQGVASSAERSIAMWEDAVRAVQFDGMAKEGTQFKAWKDAEGDALKEHEGQNAVRLYFSWLSLTLQRSSGVPLKDLLPAVINYTKDLAADQAGMENLEETIQHEKDLAASGKKTNPRKTTGKEIKKLHDSILNKPLGGSVVVQWLKLGEFVEVDKWEPVPGNYDGIFTTIILPELRAQHDARLVEYWDVKLKKEGDASVKSKLSFEINKFNTLRRPALLWSRAMDIAAVGLKNRAITEMFNVVKSFPTHPDAAGWMAKLEEMLAPAPPATSTAPPVDTSTPSPATPPAGR